MTPVSRTNPSAIEAQQDAAKPPARLRTLLRRPGIRGKMIAVIVLPTLAIYVLVLGVMLGRFVATNRRDVQQNMTQRALRCADRFDAAFEEAAAITRTTAALMESVPDITEDQLLAQLRANVQQNDLVYGAAVAFEPGSFKHDDSLYCPYVHRHGQALESMNITREVYDWYADPRWQWWHLPRQSGAPAWTDPYFDEGAGNVLMVTYSVPFHRNGRFRGVATLDVQVSKLREHIAGEILDDTEFLILTRNGDFVYSPREHDVMSGRTLFDVMDAAGRADVTTVFRTALAGSSGAADLAPWTGAPPHGWERWAARSWVFYAPIRSAGWTFAAIVPESVALGPARARVTEVALALGLTLFLIIACIFLVGSLVTRPISRLALAVRRIASGDLDHQIDDAGRDELGRLAHDVNVMAQDLKLRTEQMARARSSSREAVIFAMARLAESRDDDTGKHLERICRYSEILAEAVADADPSLSGEWVRTVAATAALHDIGKVGIPDAVLKKPGKLTDDERREMQTHTMIGGDTLLDLRREWSEDDFLRIAAEIALGHHEHWDGSGYPYGLAGEDIALSARIVAVADVYDALRSKRVYKPAMPHEQAVQLIVGSSGKQFDPRVIAAFRRVEERFREISEAMNAGARPS